MSSGPSPPHVTRYVLFAHRQDYMCLGERAPALSLAVARCSAGFYASLVDLGRNSVQTCSPQIPIRKCAGIARSSSRRPTSNQKNGAPRLGPGAPEGASQMPVSFSHRRVGSSILASLSEAGGQRSAQIASKPLPPRLQFRVVRLLLRAHVSLYARSKPTKGGPPSLYKTLICHEITQHACASTVPKTTAVQNRNSPRDLPVRS